MRFKDRVIIVTGSSRGIGKSTALAFSEEGATVIINCHKDSHAGENVAEEIRRSGKKARFIRADISNENEVRGMVDEVIASYGKIDVLINNAGFAKQSALEDLSSDDFKKTLDINLVGPFLCSKYVFPEMRKKSYGRIVMVSSIRGLENCARKDLIDYSAAKAGVISVAIAMAKEGAAYGINVNVVAPAITRTELARNLTDEAKRAAVEGSFLKRMAEPEEVRGAILFLASEEASYITGEVLVVDGGYRLTKL